MEGILQNFLHCIASSCSIALDINIQFCSELDCVNFSRGQCRPLVSLLFIFLKLHFCFAVVSPRFLKCPIGSARKLSVELLALHFGHRSMLWSLSIRLCVDLYKIKNGPSQNLTQHYSKYQKSLL